MYNMFFGRRKKFQLNKAETTYKVHYLGNVMTSLIKGNYHHGQLNESKLKQDCEDTVKPTFKNNIEDENILDNEDDVDSISIKIAQENALNKRFNNTVCNVDKPVKILWDNHLKHNGHAGLKMKLTLTQGGLRVDTKDHGLTEYYGHRIHFIQSHPLHPKLFVWVYQHVGKNLKTEIRCHAALCQSVRDSRTIQLLLNDRLQRTFLEYKREKRRQQNSRLCNNKNGGLLAGQFGTRKRSFRSTKNYKPPVQHGMSSAPKLDDVIEEEEEIDEREINEIKIDEESENEETFIENEITPAETHSLDDEDDYGDDEEDELNTNEEYEHHIDTTNKRPVIEQLILSSSSTSSTSSPSSSPLHSNLSSPSLAQNKQPSDIVNASISSPSSSSHSSELINYSNQTYIDSETNSSEINDVKLVDNKFKNLIESLKLGDVDSDHKDFTEVSYDFLADLSKKSISRSYSNRNYKLVTSSVDNPLVDESTIKPSGFYNPFRRTNISKSFSTFTTRLRQQQKQKTADLFNMQNSLKNQLKEQSNDETNEFKHSQISRSTNGLSKHLSDSTSSPLSSPDLSTSSSSSLNSSIVTNKNCQLIQSSND